MNEPDFYDNDTGQKLSSYVCAEDYLGNLYSTYAEANTCDGMDADLASEVCQRAIKQLTAVVLNDCSGRFDDVCVVDLDSVGCFSTTIPDLITELDELIAAGQCLQAQQCAAAINEGTHVFQPVDTVGVRVDDWETPVNDDGLRDIGLSNRSSTQSETQAVEPDAGDLRRNSPERGASRVEPRRQSRSKEISLDSTSAETSETSTTLNTITPEALSASSNDTLLTTLVVQAGLPKTRIPGAPLSCRRPPPTVR